MSWYLLVVISFTPLAIALVISHYFEWQARRETLAADRERDRVNRALARSRTYSVGRAR